MGWGTLVRLGIKPEKGLEIDELDSASKVSALPSPKRLRAGRSKAFITCLCLGLFRGLNESGLGEPFGKASLANTGFGLGRFISMRGRSSWTGEVW